MELYRHREFDQNIFMIAEEANFSRYYRPTIWARYHLIVTVPSSSENGGHVACRKIIHYGFDFKKTADRVWDELVMILEVSQKKLEFICDFDLDDLALTDVEGRMIKYQEKGKKWAVFPVED